ncbi:MAG TPA: transporter substrate-binding domain-containing protein, partial [Spirochaetota bacterium]|nr:transporter substrate-binding domain-containing protein [Spirochaetota bacterium]
MRFFLKITIISITFIYVSYARSWSSIKRSGYIRISSRIRKGVLNQNRKSGFHYELIKDFASENNLKIKLHIVKNLKQYFSKNIFAACDLIVDNLTITAERQKKMTFIKIFPIKQIVITLADHENIEKIRALRK